MSWEVDGGLLPGDAIFTSLDCATWNISWAKVCLGSAFPLSEPISRLSMALYFARCSLNHPYHHKGGCVGGGEGSMLEEDGFYYHLIEAPDLS